MPERLLPEQQNPKEIQSERLPIGALLVAAGISKEHAGKRKIADTEQVLSALAQRKPEDLSGHHQAVAELGTQRKKYPYCSLCFFSRTQEKIN